MAEAIVLARCAKKVWNSQIREGHRFPVCPAGLCSEEIIIFRQSHYVWFPVKSCSPRSLRSCKTSSKIQNLILKLSNFHAMRPWHCHNSVNCRFRKICSSFGTKVFISKFQIKSNCFRVYQRVLIEIDFQSDVNVDSVFLFPLFEFLNFWIFEFLLFRKRNTRPCPIFCAQFCCLANKGVF